MTVLSPAEVFYSHTPEDELRYWGHDVPLETMLSSLERATEHDTMLEFLDSFQLGDSERSYAGYILGRLPAKVLFDAYGEGVLAWAAANASYFEQKETLEDGLAELAGYDKNLFEKARLWAWRKHCTSSGREVLSQYAIMEALTGGALNQLDLPNLLHDAAHPSVELSPKRINDYQLIPLRTLVDESLIEDYAEGWFGEVEPGLAYKIWLDTPSGFALTYKGRPNALVGVACLGQKELMIYQLQGVQAQIVNPDKKYTDEYEVRTVSSRGLAPLDWQKLMITASTQLAINLGMESVGIQQGEKNKWANKILRGETKPHLTVKEAARAYDAPAKRLGFTRGKDGNWHKSLA